VEVSRSVGLGTAAFYRSWFLPLHRQPACFHGNGERKIAVVTSNGGVGTASFVVAGVAVGVGAAANRLLRATPCTCISAAILERRQLLAGSSFKALVEGILALTIRIIGRVTAVPGSSVLGEGAFGGSVNSAPRGV
jgi:hypothetical protein